MVTLMSGLFAGLLPYIASAVAALAGAAWLYLRGRRSGQQAERAKQAERTADAIRMRTEIDAAVGGAADDELDNWMRHPDRR